MMPQRCLSFAFAYLVAVWTSGDLLSGMDAAKYFTTKAQISFAEAAASGDTSAIEVGLEKGMDVNVRGQGGMTPTIFALANRNVAGFKYLLEHGANTNLQTDDGESAVSFAAIAPDPAFLTLALKHGGNPNLVSPVTGQTPIYRCIEAFRVENLNVLIAKGADLNFRDRVGDTPMAHAANLNRYDLVFVLLKAGADPAIANRWGKTIMTRISRNRISPESPLFEWRRKVIDLLGAKGIQIQE